MREGGREELAVYTFIVKLYRKRNCKTHMREIKKLSKWRRKEKKKRREIQKEALDFSRLFPER